MRLLLLLHGRAASMPSASWSAVQRRTKGPRPSAARPLQGRLRLRLHGGAAGVLLWLRCGTRPALALWALLLLLLLLLVLVEALLLRRRLRPALLPQGRPLWCHSPTAASRPTHWLAAWCARCTSLLCRPIVSIGLEAWLLVGGRGSAACHLGLLWRRRLGGCTWPRLCEHSNRVAGRRVDEESAKAWLEGHI